VNLQRAKTITLVWIDIIKPQVLSLSITRYWKVSLTTISLVDSSVIFLLSSNSKQELSPENKCLLVSQCPSQAEWVSTQQCWSMVVSAVNLWLSCAMHLRTDEEKKLCCFRTTAFMGSLCRQISFSWIFADNWNWEVLTDSLYGHSNFEFIQVAAFVGQSLRTNWHFLAAFAGSLCGQSLWTNWHFLPAFAGSLCGQKCECAFTRWNGNSNFQFNVRLLFLFFLFRRYQPF